MTVPHVPHVPHEPLVARGRPSRWARWALVAALLVTTGSIVRPSATVALGPVRAVSVDETAEIPFNPIGYVFNPTISGRGEAVTFHDREVQNNGFALLDSIGAEPVTEGLGTAVSGSGCVAVWARLTGSQFFEDGVAIGVTNRCDGTERELLRTSRDYDLRSPIAVSFTGGFALIQLPPPPVIIEIVGPTPPPAALVAGPAAAQLAQQQPFPAVFGPGVFRVDTGTSELRGVPLPPGFVTQEAVFGMDISDDGQTAAVPMRTGGQNVSLEVVVWDAPSNGVAVVSNPTGTAGASAHPSLSGDGRYVAFSSVKRLTGTETGRGPWVFVHDRAAGTYVRVSGAADSSYFSSLSGDATQVAYAVSPAPCRFIFSTPEQLEQTCPTGRIDVAFGTEPGLTSATVEPVSLDVNNRVAGFHAQPAISANGRWVAWISDSGNALLGANRQELGGRHAFVRRRDALLTVDPLNFGPVLAGTSATGTTTVRNIGRTSVVLERLDAEPPRFVPVGGGTCALGLVLAPGASCTMNIRFNAPATPGDSVGTVTVGETGYDAILPTNTLTGRSTATPPPSTTTTTTRPGQVPPGPTTTTARGTTTTIARSITLSALPNPIDFGQVAVGIGSPIQTITVTNTGNVPAQIVTAMGGPNPDDFFVSQNLCNGLTLEPGQSCAIDVIMVALAGGNRTATLSINVPNVGGEDVVLSGQGRFSPRLIASPSAITERGFTTIVGQGFPPDRTFDVHIGDTGVVIQAIADATGVFRIPYSAFGNLTLGTYVLRVDAVPDEFELVQNSLVVSLPTFQPQGPGGPVFGDSILVTRGG